MVNCYYTYCMLYYSIYGALLPLHHEEFPGGQMAVAALADVVAASPLCM